MGLLKRLNEHMYRSYLQNLAHELDEFRAHTVVVRRGRLLVDIIIVGEVNKHDQVSRWHGQVIGATCGSVEQVSAGGI